MKEFDVEAVRKALSAPTALQRHDALIALGMEEWQATLALQVYNNRKFSSMFAGTEDNSPKDRNKT